jgi:hypothetical protein
MQVFHGFSQEKLCMVESSAHDMVQSPHENHALNSRSDLWIPVVFHIVYESEKENFTDLEVQAQLDVLNRDFNLMSENVIQIPEAFKKDAAKTGIRFCLASEDPAGEPSGGITRTLTNFQNIGSSISPEGRKRIHYDFLGGHDAWDPTRYLNIWVGNLESVIGFATFPEQAPFPEEDGVIIDPAYFGVLRSFPFQQPNKGHTLTHEIGHYLNLLHLWGANNSPCDEDDQVSDTPLQEGPNFGCGKHPVFSCGSADMFMNFMDFSNDECVAFFTHGQVDRMIQTLETMREGLINGNVSCKVPAAISEEAFQQNFIFHYLREVNSILVRQIEPVSSKVKIECFGVDGRLYRAFELNGDATFLIPTDYLPGGVIILRMSIGQIYFSKKFVLY